MKVITSSTPCAARKQTQLLSPEVSDGIIYRQASDSDMHCIVNLLKVWILSKHLASCGFIQQPQHLAGCISTCSCYWLHGCHCVHVAPVDLQALLVGCTAMSKQIHRQCQLVDDQVAEACFCWSLAVSDYTCCPLCCEGLRWKHVNQPGIGFCSSCSLLVAAA